MNSKLIGTEPNHNCPRPAKVVLVTGSLRGGGSERVLSDMANYWAQKDWHVTFATWSGPEIEDFYEIDSSVQRVWLDVSTPNNSSLARFCSSVLRIRRLRKLLKDIKPDAVLSFIDRSNVQTIVAAIGLSTRVVVSERTNPAYYSGLSWQWERLRKIFYSRAQAVVAQTDDVAGWLEQECAASSYVIPNPLRSLPTMVVPREPTILTVGRLDFAKGVDILLKAFARIHHDFGEWRVVVVGDGPEKPALIRLSEDLHLTAKVEFVPPVKNIESLMSRAGLVVQPSRLEGFPNVLIEAMGMGAPVISANCPSGPSEIIQDGINGRLFPVDDVGALAEMMADLMSQPETRVRIGDKAAGVRRKYRQGPIMEQWEACLIHGRDKPLGCDSYEKEVPIER